MINWKDKKPAAVRKKNFKKKTKKNLVIHNIENVELTVIPEGSVAICSESIKVQDILIRPNNTRYTRKVWKTPDGKLIRAKWPVHINGQFGFHLKSYIISLYFDSHMTQPAILRHLTEIGIDISSGEIHNILIENKDLFHKEKEDILKVGLQISKSITTDDTGLRHRGANGYCTHIGNEFFAYFKSSNSKSRINFLEIPLEFCLLPGAEISKINRNGKSI
ncbi:MAG: hypothetical protein OEV66_00625 [Spirochaetia bacterium]|nr:hypothetical protein [Spirochaetia bacterium]